MSLEQKIAEKIIDWRDGSNTGNGPNLEETVYDIIKEVKIDSIKIVSQPACSTLNLKTPPTKYRDPHSNKTYTSIPLGNVIVGESYVLARAEFNSYSYYNVVAGSMAITGSPLLDREFIEPANNTSHFVTENTVKCGKFIIFELD